MREYHYGDHPSQFARLHLPEAGGGWPVAVVIHGGFWRQRYGVELADPLAADLARRGVAALAVEYRRVDRRVPDGSRTSMLAGPAAEAGGGWPMTLVDVATAVDSLAASGQVIARGRLDLTRVAAVGHSAGGHLAAWLAHRSSLGPEAPGAMDEHSVRLVGAVSQAGVLDLQVAARDGLGDGAVLDLMEGSPGSVALRYRHASPIGLIGDGAKVVCVHGGIDDTVPPGQSVDYVSAATAAGDPAELITLPDVGHMELVDPGDPAWSVCRARLVDLLAR